MIARYKISKHEGEKKALLNVFENGAWVNGDELNKASVQLKKIFNKKYCILTSNGYSALFLAIKSLGIKNEKIIIPVASTCFAIVNAVIASGNQPVFADMNQSDATINLESAKRLQKRHNAKCIIVANLFGNLTNCLELKKKLGIPVIEDCAQSFLSNANHTSAADIQVFSFYPSKIINGIDGGCVLTNNEQVAGYIKDVVYYDEQLKYDGIERFNMRMPNIHAAVLLSNLKKLKSIKRKYKSLQSEYKNEIGQFMPILGGAGMRNIYSRFIFIFSSEKEKKYYKKKLLNHSIQVGEVLVNVSNQEIKKESSVSKLINETLSIPYYSSLKARDRKKIFQILNRN